MRMVQDIEEKLWLMQIKLVSPWSEKQTLAQITCA
jgi:hypothetical protein